jgi:hypothetical protein
MYRTNQTTAKDQEAQTPDWLLKEIHSRFTIKFDPCPHNPTFDGKAIPWKNYAYVNPPFKETAEWLQIAIDSKKNCLFLLPFTKMHRLFFKKYFPFVSGIWLMNKMVCFKNYKKPLNKAMMLLEVGRCCKTLLPSSKKAYYWDLPNDQLYLKTLHQHLRTAAPASHKVIQLQSQLAKKLPKIFNSSPNLILLIPSRLDLKFLRNNLTSVSTLIICPHLKNPKNDHYSWVATLVLVKGNIPEEKFIKRLPYMNHNNKMVVQTLQF